MPFIGPVAAALVIAPLLLGTPFAPPARTTWPPGPEAAAPLARASPRWSWPILPRPVVVQGFSVGPDPWDPGHRGVDLAATPGTPVLAPADGVVRFAGELAGRGVVSLDHGDDVLSSFEPVVAGVRKGAAVHRGEVIGRVEDGHSHCVPGSCLHWGVREDGRYVDPLTLLGVRPGEVILLPVGTAG